MNIFLRHRPGSIWAAFEESPIRGRPAYIKMELVLRKLLVGPPLFRVNGEFSTAVYVLENTTGGRA